MSCDARPLKVGATRGRAPPARGNKIGRGERGLTASPEPMRHGAGQAELAVLRLARLIGRQIAREEFERWHATEQPSRRRQEIP